METSRKKSLSNVHMLCSKAISKTFCHMVELLLTTTCCKTPYTIPAAGIRGTRYVLLLNVALSLSASTVQNSGTWCSSAESLTWINPDWWERTYRKLHVWRGSKCEATHRRGQHTTDGSSTDDHDTSTGGDPTEERRNQSEGPRRWGGSCLLHICWDVK